MCLMLACGQALSQNNLSLQMEDGAAFRVLINEKVFNDSAQAQVLIPDIREDTLFVKIETAPALRYGVTLYLMDKGRKTTGKEFSYVLKKEKNRLRPVFMGIYDIKTFKKPE